METMVVEDVMDEIVVEDHEEMKEVMVAVVEEDELVLVLVLVEMEMKAVEDE